jgi:predicted ester cyclase
MVKAFNTGDLDIVDELLAPSHQDGTPFPGTSSTREGLKQQITHLREAFPDAEFSIVHLVAEGETVAFRWKMVGTQRGVFLDRPPSKKRIEHFGNDIVVFRRGKMIRHESSDGHRQLLRKLGHDANELPPPTD